MKIAIFYNLAFGGAKRVVMEHAKGLKKKGYFIDLYTTNHEKDAFDPSPFCDNIYNYKIEISSSLPILKRLVIDYKKFIALKNLHKIIANDIDNNNYDLVLVHPDKFTQAPYILQYLKTRSAYYCQEPLRIAYEYSMRFTENVNIAKRIYEEFTRYYRKQRDRKNVRSATLTIASCYHVRERMIESYEVFPKVTYCAVDNQIFRQLNINKKNQILFIGSPSVKEDGYDLAVNALNLIPTKIRPKLFVVSWKKENGERLTESELVKIYNESIVTLCTSRLETFGLVPLETMACGTPVIATNISGHRETIVDQETGFLVDFDIKEISDKIIYLIKNPKIAKKISDNAVRYINNQWTWEKSILNLENIFKKI